MLEISKRYIVDENNTKLAVEIDIDTFSRIEEILENFALWKLMQETESEILSLSEAKSYYELLVN